MRWKFRYIGTALAVAIATLVNVDTAHAIGTASGTTIGNRATVRWTSGSASQDTTTASIDTTVRSVFGETIPNIDTNTFGVGETTTFTYQIMNNGNATDSFNVNIVDSTLVGGASGWTIRLFVGNQSTTGTGSLPTTLVAADGTFSCSVQIVSNSNPANSPDGSYMQFYLRVRSESNPTAAEYTGDNGTLYSVGGGTTFDTAWAKIASANITVAKVITTVTRGGTASLPIPGATITYELTYSNTGSDSADSAVLYDTIPTNTRMDSMSSTISALGATATFSNDTGQTGWTAQYSTVASPSLAYDSTDFVNLVGNEAGRGNATVVRWIKQEVGPPEDNLTIRFRVIIQ